MYALSEVCGRSNGTWTHGLLTPSQARYQTALYPDNMIFYVCHEIYLIPTWREMRFVELFFSVA